MIDTFDDIENEFLTIAAGAYRVGYHQPGRVGACAL